MSDDDGKTGFFGRLFGRKADAPAPAEPAPVVAKPAPELAFVDVTPAVPEPAAELVGKKSWWSRLKQGLSRSSSSIGIGISDIFTKRKLDAETLEELEDVLIRADLGVVTAARIDAPCSRRNRSADACIHNRCTSKSRSSPAIVGS